ncbi:MAG: GlsB/YeaQ/YmgE family stress response membrane protein [Alphaproteobacteria bacterium]|nr:GlsB/YeaQ/YmgE family stress response membrane protein [Alphaproteobacteria bacterium]
MAVLVLILLGAIAGWLASIIARTEAPGAILRQIAIGLVTALVAGTIANSGTMLGSLSLLGLGGALAVSAVALALYHAILRRRMVKHISQNEADE